MKKISGEIVPMRSLIVACFKVSGQLAAETLFCIFLVFRNVLIQLPQEHHLSVAVSMERKLRMVVLGASRTGKTQLMSRFMGKDFR